MFAGGAVAGVVIVIAVIAGLAIMRKKQRQQQELSERRNSLADSQSISSTTPEYANPAYRGMASTRPGLEDFIHEDTDNQARKNGQYHPEDDDE